MEYKVLKSFRDRNTKQVYKIGEVIDVTKKRAAEIEKNLGDGFITGYKEKPPEEKTPEEEGAGDINGGATGGTA